jgi:hypothetical protein
MPSVNSYEMCTIHWSDSPRGLSGSPSACVCRQSGGRRVRARRDLEPGARRPVRVHARWPDHLLRAVCRRDGASRVLNVASAGWRMERAGGREFSRRRRPRSFQLLAQWRTALLHTRAGLQRPFDALAGRTRRQALEERSPAWRRVRGVGRQPDLTFCLCRRDTVLHLEPGARLCRLGCLSLRLARGPVPTT